MLSPYTARSDLKIIESLGMNDDEACCLKVGNFVQSRDQGSNQGNKVNEVCLHRLLVLACDAAQTMSYEDSKALDA